MPTIGNSNYTLLQGLSDFWVRFYADYKELEAMYQGTELSIAQTYLDMLSSFLNISIEDTPIFNTEFFKLVRAREDGVVFDEAANVADSVHRMAMPDNLVEAHILQNKVADPTASLEIDAGYRLDTAEFDFLFNQDPSGYPGRVLGTTTVGSLTVYGNGSLTECSVPSGTPFAKAKIGSWVQVRNSGSGNDKLYQVASVLSEQRVTLQGTFTLPEVNNGSLTCSLLDAEFTPIEGFAYRTVNIAVGGSFDDSSRRERPATDIGSWYMDAPSGLGVRKGDFVHIADRAVVSTPLDLKVAVVRHDKIYFSKDTPAPKNAENVGYVVLREPDNVDAEDNILFVETGTAKTDSNGSVTATLDAEGHVTELFFDLPAGPTVPFAPTDKQRFINLSGCGTITWDADIAADGTLTWKNTSSIPNPLARASVGGTVNVSGTYAGLEDGEYPISALTNDHDCVLRGSFTPSTNVTVTLDWITNAGTYRIKKVEQIAGEYRRLVLSTPVTANDPNNGSLGWRIHDGYRATLSHTYVAHDSEVVQAGVGNGYTGGRRLAQRDVDFVVDYDKGEILQTGVLAGTWGITSSVFVSYEWFKVVLAASTLVDTAIPGAVTDSINATTRIITLDQTNVETALSTTVGFNALAHTNQVFRVSGSSVAGNNRNYRIEAVLNTYTIRVAETPAQTVTESFLAAKDGVYTPGCRGVLDANTTELLVSEVSFWAPDVKVDKYHLYNTYGYLINRFEPSSEQYREFIRGVFQLYMLGPTLERIESALNVIIRCPVIRDDGEVLVSFDDTHTDYDLVRTRRVDGTIGEYEFPKPVITPPASLVRDDVSGWVTGDAPITFESFEPLTTLFTVTDYVQDPTWWDSAVIPTALAPTESLQRRIASPVLIENVIGSYDLPHVGDPGLFIGADDEGLIPPYTDAPAKRRKMANVVLDRFLKYHMLFVSVDPNVYELVETNFIEDIRDLVLVAKPSWKYLYLEPANNFTDQIRVTEDVIEQDGALTLDAEVVRHDDNEQTIQSFSWNIGDVWRRGAPVLSEALFVVSGSIPPPKTLAHDHVIAARVHSSTSWHPQEYIDYVLEYETGVLTPLTLWADGTYTIEYGYLVVSDQSVKDASIGDTDMIIGGSDPFLVRPRVRLWTTGAISTVAGRKVFSDAAANFTSLLHTGKDILLRTTSSVGLYTIERVLSPTQVRLTHYFVPDNTGIVWSFASEEPLDGEFFYINPYWFFRSGMLTLTSLDVEKYVHVVDSLAGNNGYHKIHAVMSMHTVRLGGSFAFTPETDVHFRLEGTPQRMMIVERPVQISITTAP